MIDPHSRCGIESRLWCQKSEYVFHSFMCLISKTNFRVDTLRGRWAAEVINNLNEKLKKGYKLHASRPKGTFNLECAFVRCTVHFFQSASCVQAVSAFIACGMNISDVSRNRFLVAIVVASFTLFGVRHSRGYHIMSHIDDWRMITDSDNRER